MRRRLSRGAQDCSKSLKCSLLSCSGDAMTYTQSLRLAGFLLVGILAVSPSSAQTPVLQYNAPAGFTPGRDGGDPQVFIDPMLEGSVEVYAFRPFQGDFRTSFLRTLFAGRMSPG